MNRLTRLCAVAFATACVATTPVANAADVQVGSSTIAIPDFVPPQLELAPVVVPRPFGSMLADLPPLPYPLQWEAKYDFFSGNTVVLNCLDAPEKLPNNIIVACGDGNLQFQNAKWDTWENRSATGTAEMVFSDCIPACYNGTIHRIPVHLRLHDVRQIDGRDVFTHMTINDHGNIREQGISGFQYLDR